MSNIKTATLGFILGVAGTLVVQHCTSTQEVTLSKSEYYKLKGAELEIKCSEAVLILVVMEYGLRLGVFITFIVWFLS